MQRHFLIWNNVRDAIVSLTVILLIIGCINVFSASYVDAGENIKDGYYYLKRYAAFAVLSLSAMLWLGFKGPDYRVWLQSKFCWAIYGIVFAMLVYVECFGMVIKGSQRWISLGFASIQPAEFAKLCVIMLSTSILGNFMDRHIRPNFIKAPTSIVFWATLIFAGMVLLQPDMGTAAIIVALAVCMYIVAGVKIRQVVALVVVGLLGVAGLIWLEPYRLNRILVFLDPWSDTEHFGYQIVQSLIAIGSGGLTGIAWGQGSSKYFYLPEAHTDFAFAVFCQEWGFFGACFLIALFACLGLALCRVAGACKSHTGFLLVSGVTFLVVGQAAVNMLIVCGLIPVIGVPLPFISYGGSSMMVILVALGLVLSVYRAEVKDEKIRQQIEQGVPNIAPLSDRRHK